MTTLPPIPFEVPIPPEQMPADLDDLLRTLAPPPAPLDVLMAHLGLRRPVVMVKPSERTDELGAQILKAFLRLGEPTLATVTPETIKGLESPPDTPRIPSVSEWDTLLAPPQVPVRLVWSTDEPRTYAQSASGHSSSQVTRPPDSRSTAIAKSGEQDLQPYATLRRWPHVVPQRSANADRSSGDMGLSKAQSFGGRFMGRRVHHMVSKKATPKGVSLSKVRGVDNSGMALDTPEIRRENLRRLITLHFGGNKSALARAYAPDDPSPSFFNDLLRPGTKKSFGEKLARKIEDKVGIVAGQLSIPDSPLRMVPRGDEDVEEAINAHIAGMSRAEKLDLLSALVKKGKRAAQAPPQVAHPETKRRHA